MGPSSKGRRGGGGWQRFGTRLASAKTSHVDDHVVSARRKLTSGALRGLRSTVEKSTLRTPGRGREGRPGLWGTLWAAQGHQRAAQRPICAPILQRCPNPSGGNPGRQPPWTAGRRAHEGAHEGARMSQRPRGLFHSLTGQSATPPISDVVAATSATQQQRPAFKTTTRRVEPLEKGS